MSRPRAAPYVAPSAAAVFAHYSKRELLAAALELAALVDNEGSTWEKLHRTIRDLRECAEQEATAERDNE